MLSVNYLTDLSAGGETTHSTFSKSTEPRRFLNGR
jgi:hypothetical protein